MASDQSSTLATIYQNYIQAILDHDLESMTEYVSQNVVHNGHHLGLEGYKQLLSRNIVEPDLSIGIKRLIADAGHVAAILTFTTKASTKELVGVPLAAEPFSYSENVIYDFENGKIAEVHSLFDIDTVRSHARQS